MCQDIKIEGKKFIIRNALKALGISEGRLSIPSNENTVGSVYINGVYFGLFDYIKRTFVD